MDIPNLLLHLKRAVLIELIACFHRNHLQYLKSFLVGQSIFCDNVHTDHVRALVVVCTTYCALQKAGLEGSRFRAAPNALSVGTYCYVVDCRCGRLGGARRFGAHR